VSTVLHRIGWIGLTVVAAFLLVAVASDLSTDHVTGLPSDHAGAFTAIAGRSFDAVRSASPGVASYITVLETGYALHERTFAVLFLAVVLVPLRQRQQWAWWAWWACWAVEIANLGYTFTVARHDPVILARSLLAVVAVPVLLLCAAPAMLHRTSSLPAGSMALALGSEQVSMRPTR
jgi:hypothetical protein